MATFELYRDPKGEYRWRLKHSNGQMIANGGEGYSSKRSALAGIESVKKNAPDADISEIQPGQPAKPVAASSSAEGAGRLS